MFEVISGILSFLVSQVLKSSLPYRVLHQESSAKLWTFTNENSYLFGVFSTILAALLVLINPWKWKAELLPDHLIETLPPSNCEGSSNVEEENKTKQSSNFLFSSFLHILLVTLKIITCTSLPRLSHSFSSQKRKKSFFSPLVCAKVDTDWYIFVHSMGFYAVRGHELHIEFMLTQ